MSYKFNWGKAAGGAATGFITTGMNPFGLLAGIPAGIENNVNVDDVLPEFDAAENAKELVRKGTINDQYARSIGQNNAAADSYAGNLIAGGLDAASAQRIAEAQRASGAAQINDSTMQAEKQAVGNYTSQLLGRQYEREDDRQSFINEQNNQPSTLESVATPVIGAMMGNMAAGGGLFGRDAMLARGADTITTNTATGEVANTDFSGNVTNQGERGFLQSLLYGKTNAATINSPEVAEDPMIKIRADLLSGDPARVADARARMQDYNSGMYNGNEQDYFSMIAKYLSMMGGNAGGVL